MKESQIKERLYFKNIISKIIYEKQRFKITDVEIENINIYISTKDKNSIFDKIAQYRLIYETLLELDWKIKISLDKAIKYTFSTKIYYDFNLISKNTDQEKITYYYIENAIYRISILWDILAQLYNTFFELNIGKNKIYYKKLFSNKINQNKNFQNKSKKIYEYINQKDDTDCKGEWKGNHFYINNLRNQMTHRNSPNISAFSNFKNDTNINIKDHPVFILKRIIEDYNVVSKYIADILDEIEKDILKSFENEKN